MESRGKLKVVRGGLKRREGEADGKMRGGGEVKKSRQYESSDGSAKDSSVLRIQLDQPIVATQNCYKGKGGKAVVEGTGAGVGEGTSGTSAEGFFEEHSCNLMENCTDQHESQTPYLWRVKLNGQWIRLVKENSTIEKAFCDPNVEEFWDVESIPGVAVCLNFSTMQALDFGPIQRLSTPSYVQRRDQLDATRWQWYWHDAQAPQPWNLYGKNNEAPHQDVLEAKFLHNPRRIYRLEIENQTYDLDFAKMEQRNRRTNFRRRICRRPIYFEDIRKKTLSTEYHYNPKKLPPGWVPMDTESKHGTELVPLNEDSETYQAVSRYFFATMDPKQFEIKQILGLQNLELWTNYQTKKTNMEIFSGQADEGGLFHGTPKEETVHWICSLGFDQRMNGTHGTKYGKGAYFASAASYSHTYTCPSGTEGIRHMFYARVLVGQTVEGKSEYRRPPPIDPHNPKRGLYDTCVDNVAQPGIYVVFDNNQSYPDFLIEYREAVTAEATQVAT